MDRENTMFKWSFGVAAAAAAAALLFVSTPILGVAMTFFYPPMLFLVNMSNGPNQHTLRVYAALCVTCYSLAGLWTLHLAETMGWIGDSAHPWMEAIRSAGVIYFLPVFLTLIRPPPVPEPTAPGPAREDGEEREEGEEEEEDAQSVQSEDEGVEEDGAGDPLGAFVRSYSLFLPGKLIVNFMTFRGTLMDTAVQEKECRVAAKAYCCYVSLTLCTVAAAAVADCAGLVAVETSLALLSVAALASLSHGAARFFLPDLHTVRAGRVFRLIVLPAALAATAVLQATGWAETKHVTDAACALRDVIWIAFVPAAMHSTLPSMRD